MAQTCSSASSLQAQYQAVINQYSVTHLDFDIEGGEQGDSTTYDRRSTALAALQAANPGLTISFTLPSATTGLLSDSLGLLNNAVSHGEIFSLSNAQQVLTFAQQNKIGELAFWEVPRDNGNCAGSTTASPSCSGISQSPYAFINAFKSFTNGSSSGTPPTPTPTKTSTPTPQPTTTATPSPGNNLVSNPGFETGSLANWSCNAGDKVVTSPVHSGSYALQVTPTSSTTGECDQTITVQANHSYTLSAYVDGPYAYMGVQSGASSWTSSGSYTRLSVTFTTSSAQTSITIYVHGWYSQGNVYADDFSLS